MLNALIRLLKKDYQTLNKIEISKSNLINNYKYLSSQNTKLKIAPVLKSNGYGHGIVNVAKIVDPINTPFICVDSLYEAYQLQKAKIKTKILVMGYTNPENFKVKKLPFTFSVCDIETAKILNKFQPNCSVHIFVDTGMHREGISLEQLPNSLNEIKALTNIKIKGLMSHLASSESKTDPIFISQIYQFKKAKEICKKAKIYPKWFHIAATGSIINPTTLPIVASVSNLARAGLALYGFSSHQPLRHSEESSTKNLSRMRGISNKLRDPSLIVQDDTTRQLKPVLTLTTKIIQIKRIKKGESVGYDGTYTAKADMTTAILPIGYYDGIDRRLSSRGYMTINGAPCKILGRVSMNITTINISEIPDPQIGTEVVVFSNNPNDLNSIQNTAKLCNTIPYDILISLAPSTKRVIV